MGAPVLLYDRDCGFCRWSVAAILRHDRRRELATAAIQDDDGQRLLAVLPVQERLRSWHLVTSGGDVRSGADVIQPLLEALGRPAAGRIAALFRAPLGLAYAQVSARRTRLGRLVSRGSVERADAFLTARALDAGDGEFLRDPAPPPVAPVESWSALASPPIAGPGTPAAIDITPGWQQRLEQSAFGRGLISTVIVLSLVAIVAINLPGSELRRDLLSPGQPYLNALGIDQNWALFAPDPRRVVIDVSASIAYDDGSRGTWTFPHDGPLIGTYRDYRWRKWEENLIDPENAAPLWRQAALWAAAQSQRPGHAIARVSLVERYAPLLPPGAPASAAPTAVRVFYVIDAPPARSGA